MKTEEQQFTNISNKQLTDISDLDNNTTPKERINGVSDWGDNY